MAEMFPIEAPVAPVQEQAAVDNVLQDKLTPGEELVIRDENGEEHYIVVMGRAYDNNGMYIHDPNGDIIQYYMDGDVKYEQESALLGKVVQREEATPVSQEHAQGDSVEVQEPIEQEKPTYVRNGKTRVAYHMMPVADTIQELFGMGMEVADVQSVAESNVAEAESDIKKHEKKQPKQKTDFADPAEFIAAKQKWQAEMQVWQAEMDDINARLAYWQDVQAELAKMIPVAETSTSKLVDLSFTISLPLDTAAKRRSPPAAAPGTLEVFCHTLVRPVGIAASAVPFNATVLVAAPAADNVRVAV